MERVIGPVNGYFVASYACPADAATFIGYSKICRARPESYWDARCHVKICGDYLHQSPEAALADTERRAREQIGNLAPRERRLREPRNHPT